MIVVIPRKGMSVLELRWRAFHAENPQVFELFDYYARELIAAGRPYYGAKSVWERIRWHLAVSTDDLVYKLNNNYHAFYARYWMHKHPKHEGFFRTRRSVADDVDYSKVWDGKNQKKRG